MDDQIRSIGHRYFTDGVQRPVWEDEQSQYVVGEDGTKIRSVCLGAAGKSDAPVFMDWPEGV